MRVLIVTETGDAWTSGYIRASIYKNLFLADGIDVCYTSRLLPSLTRLIEQPHAALSPLMTLGLVRMLRAVNRARATVREARIISEASSYDVIYLQKISSWRLVEKLRRVSKARLVYDLNDAVWLPSRAYFARGRITDILRTVDAVTCDNPFGLEFALLYNPNCFIVPDPPQVEIFDLHRNKITRPDSPIVLGWVGSPGTLFNLYLIWETLERLFSRFDNIQLRLLGVGDRTGLPPFEKVRYTTLPFYSQTQMIREALQMAIGLFPLFDIEDSRVRGALKATMYMSAETSVVASPIGQNIQLIQHGVNGFLPRTPQEWLEQLTQLIEMSEMRQRVAHAGLQTVREQFSLRKCYSDLATALRGP